MLRRPGLLDIAQHAQRLKVRHRKALKDMLTLKPVLPGLPVCVRVCP
jgi:hypothetical protein